jgi:hypothetical protein
MSAACDGHARIEDPLGAPRFYAADRRIVTVPRHSGTSEELGDDAQVPGMLEVSGAGV